jgi:hypothetical protein
MNRRMSRPGYHWTPNFHPGLRLFGVRFELTNRDDTTEDAPRGFSFYAGLLGFGIHFHRDGEYTITGIQTPLFHIGATKIETLRDVNPANLEYEAGQGY